MNTDRKTSALKIVLPVKKNAKKTLQAANPMAFDDEDADVDIYDIISKSIRNKSQKNKQPQHESSQPLKKPKVSLNLQKKGTAARVSTIPSVTGIQSTTSTEDSYDVFNDLALLSERVELMNKRLQSWDKLKATPQIKKNQTAKAKSKEPKLPAQSFLKVCKLVLDTQIDLSHIFAVEFPKNTFIDYNVFILYLYSIVHQQERYFQYKQKEKFNQILQKIQHVNEFIDTEFQEKFIKPNSNGQPQKIEASVEKGSRTVESIVVPPLVLKRLGINQES